MGSDCDEANLKSLLLTYQTPTDEQAASEQLREQQREGNSQREVNSTFQGGVRNLIDLRWNQKAKKKCVAEPHNLLSLPNEPLSLSEHENKLCLAPSFQNPLCASLNLSAPVTQIQPQFEIFQNASLLFHLI